MADDFSDDEPDSPGTVPRGGKKRANHNELERKRRQHQKDRLNDLKDVVPQLKQERPSTVLILTKAKEYIEMLEQKTAQYENELVVLRERAGMPPKPPRPLVSPNPPAGADELDALRRENLDLQTKLETLERKLQTMAKQPRPAVPPAVVPVVSPDRLPPPAEPVKPTLDVVAAVAAAAVAAESGPDPAIAMHNFRKRKSRADNDFEAAKLDFYRRRNSTVESLRDHAHRITEGRLTEGRLDEADLFQNFVVQTRRASLPSAYFDQPPPAILVEETDKVDHADMLH